MTHVRGSNIKIPQGSHRYYQFCSAPVGGWSRFKRSVSQGAESHRSLKRPLYMPMSFRFTASVDRIFGTDRDRESPRATSTVAGGSAPCGAGKSLISFPRLSDRQAILSPPEVETLRGQMNQLFPLPTKVGETAIAFSISPVVALIFTSADFVAHALGMGSNLDVG